MPLAGVYFGEDLGRYGFGDGHPFGPDRIQAFWEETLKRGLNSRLEILSPVICHEDDLTLFHTRDYIAKVKHFSRTGDGFLDQGDTPAFPGVFEAGCYVVGSGLDAMDRVIKGEIPRLFIPIAGLHHGRRNAAAGFCAFNDCGVMIEALRSIYDIKRIAYVDIDAHHGDGVYYEFEGDPDVICADIHEDGRFLYPGTGDATESGVGNATGTKLNIPVPPGCDDTLFRQVWPMVEEFVRSFDPEIILLQAGADSIKGDPITHMCFTPSAHRMAAAGLIRIADECCDGRFIAMGGGGYNRTNLALGWNEVLEAMLS